MRHLWKGFVLGGLTGAGIGLARDWDQRRRGESSEPAAPAQGIARLTSMASDNVWKGFVLGSLAGAGVGIIADIGDRAAEAAVQTGQAVREHGPELAHRAAEAASQTGQVVRERGPELAQRVAESDTVKAVGEAATQTAQRAAETADKARTTVSDLADDAKKSAKGRIDA